MTHRTAPADAAIAPVDRFAELWDAAEQSPPDLRAFLSSCGDLQARDLADVLLIDQRFRWQTGRGIPAETYLSDWPEVAADPELRSDLVYGEYRARTAHGDAPQWESFIERFADLRQTLARQAEVSRWLAETVPGAAETCDTPTVTGGSSAAIFPIVGVDSRAPLLFSDFRIEKKLGSGAMGDVFEAIQISLNKPVALKILRNVSAGSRGVERFLHEARAAAALRHPHIVDVHGLGRCLDGSYFLIMDLVPGGSLADRINSGRLSVAEAVEIAIQVSAAIGHANSRGVIHRDLKPSNVLLDAQGQAMVTDFGLARSDQSEASSSGDIIGTPQYMAPEQADERYGPIGPATDVYGLGAVLYAMLTGRAPFPGSSVAQVLARVISQEPAEDPSKVRDGIPEMVAAICQKCLRKIPAERYGSAQEVVAALESWRDSAGARTDDQPARQPTVPSQRLRTWKLVAAAGAAVVAILLVVVLRMASDKMQHKPGNQPATAKSRVIWTLDLYRNGRQDDRVRLTDYPAPVFNGDQIRLQLRFARPVHAYCFWLGSDDSVEPIYPPKQADDRPIDEIAIPPTNNEGLPIQGRPGVEICLVLVRDSALTNPSGFLAQIQALPPPQVRLDTLLADGIPILDTLTSEELKARRPDLAGPLTRLPSNVDSRNVGPATRLIASTSSAKLGDWLSRLPTDAGKLHYLAIPHAAR